MKSNVLPFPVRAAASVQRTVLETAAEIISMAEHRQTPRRLRVANGVYFVSSYPVSLPTVPVE